MSEKKRSKPEEDETTIKLPNTYKKKCDLNGVTPLKSIKAKLEMAAEEGKLQTLQLWEETGPIQIRSLMEGLSDLNYQHLKKVRLWKIDLQNEGVRSICNLINKTNTIEYLDLLDNNISVLGCQFLGKVFLNSQTKIKKLRIDNNMIGNEGLAELTQGLRVNDVIEKLSFNYCNIDQKGVKYFQQIIANIDCKLRTLKVQGNALKNEGTHQLLKAVNSCGDQLQKLNISDIQMNILGANIEEQGANQAAIQNKIAYELTNLIKDNKSIAKYNFRNNWIPDSVVKKMLEAAKENKIIFLLELPEGISHKLKQLHAQTMKKRKLKKKGKKKGKAKTKK